MALPPKFTITNRITAGLPRIERARGFLEAATLSEAWVREMGGRALILEATIPRTSKERARPSRISSVCAPRLTAGLCSGTCRPWWT